MRIRRKMCTGPTTRSNTGTWQDVIQSVSLGWAGTDDYGVVLPSGTKVAVVVTARPNSELKDKAGVSPLQWITQRQR